MHLNQSIDNNTKSHHHHLLEQDLKKILTQIFIQVTDLELDLISIIKLARNYNKIINIIFLFYYN